MVARATTHLEDHNYLLDKLSFRNEPSAHRKALHSIVELHTFVQTKRGKSGLSKRCTECGFSYPCPTIEAINKELK